MNCVPKSRSCTLLSAILNLKPQSCPQITANRYFRTSQPKSAIPPAIIFALAKASKIGSAIVGRSFRWWWQRLPLEKKKKLFQKAKHRRKYLFGTLGGTSLLGLGYYQTHIEEAPITKRKRFVAFNDEQFNEISIQFHAATLVEHESHIISPHSSGHGLYKRVVDVAERLLNANRDIEEISSKFWRITVVDDDNEVNAYAWPCGGVFVFTGMLKMCSNDDQLAIILGHELAHAILGHGKEISSFKHLLDLLVMIPFAMVWALIPSDITSAALHWVSEKLMDTMMHLPYERFMEAEADAVGLQLAAKACFDVREAPVLWFKMDGLGSSEDGMFDQWLSTHPTNKTRQIEMEKLMSNALQIREECSCPRLPFRDPRDGDENKTRLQKLWKELDELQVELEIK